MKRPTSSKSVCIDCEQAVSDKEKQYSTSKFGLTMCLSCQDSFRGRMDKSTPDAAKLYVALRLRGVYAELEKYDGFKTIDIAVTEAKVNIEVDGMQHNYNPDQALADLKRTYHSFKKGYLTLRIPNSLIRNDLEQTANFITDFLFESREQLYYN